MDNLTIIIVALISGISTYVISYYLDKGTVFGSAVVTLIAGLFLPYFFPETGASLATVAATASYAGQVSQKNVPNLGEMAIVSLIVGAVFITFTTSYVGIGGKLGTMAAVSCFIWLGFKRVFFRKASSLETQAK